MSEEEIKLIKEMQQNCVNQANYVDIKATDKYNALEHVLQQNRKYKGAINKIKKICNKVPYDWSVCGIEVIHKIEKVLAEVE